MSVGSAVPVSGAGPAVDSVDTWSQVVYTKSLEVKMMNTVRHQAAEAALWATLALGIFFFLREMHSTGEAPETFRLIFSAGPGSIAGALGVLVAGTALVTLHLIARRKTRG